MIASENAQAAYNVDYSYLQTTLDDMSSDEENNDDLMSTYQVGLSMEGTFDNFQLTFYFLGIVDDTMFEMILEDYDKLI